VTTQLQLVIIVTVIIIIIIYEWPRNEIRNSIIRPYKVYITLSHFNLFYIVTKFSLTYILISFTHLLPHLISFRFAEQFFLPDFWIQFFLTSELCHAYCYIENRAEGCGRGTELFIKRWHCYTTVFLCSLFTDSFAHPLNDCWPLTGLNARLILLTR